MELDDLVEAMLQEDGALTQGSQRIFNNKNLVAAIANEVRDDADFRPGSFPNGAAKKFEKASDEEIAKWFLEQLDNIERQGYEGTIYSRGGIHSDWITKVYTSGASNWEDVQGNLNMLLRDWYILRNRDILEPRHKELSKFNSINQLSQVVLHHYGPQINEIRDKAKKAAMQKLAKSIVVVDNADYKITVPLNRKASVMLGSGAGWCTANAEYDGNYHSYTDKAMLFIVLPYNKEEVVKNGKKALTQREVVVRQGPNAGQKMMTVDKYQFDTGSGQFMDITNTRVTPPSAFAKAFPYMYTDLVSALESRKTDIETAFKTYSDDPTLQDKDAKIKTWDINKQIKELSHFLTAGFFTDKVRPKQLPAAEPAATDTPQLPAASAGPVQMESIHALARKMLEGIDESDEELEEEDEMPDGADAGADAATGGGLDSLGGGSSGGGGQYPPGTAPTMPESAQQKGNNMNNVDKDIAAMLGNLKKYDKLTESVAPVLMGKPKTVVNTIKPKTVVESVDPQSIQELATKLSSGEITYDEFRDQLESLEITADSMRQGEMGMMGGDTPAGNRAFARDGDDWNDMDDEWDTDMHGDIHNTDDPYDIDDPAPMENMYEGEDAKTSQQRGTDNTEKVAKDAFAAKRAQKRNDDDEAWAKSKGKVKEEVEELDEETVDDFKKRGGNVQELPYKGGKKEKREAGKSTASAHIGSASGSGARSQQRGAGANVSTGSKTGNKSVPPVVGSGKKKVDESMEADQETLDWMKRFSKLGNMKGYGR